MEYRFANVIVDITHEKLDRTFQYRVPDQLKEALEPGMAVQIPFGGGGRLIRGYVTSLTDQQEVEASKMKDIQGILTGELGVEARLIALAAWIRDYYGSTMIQALKTVIPVKQKVKSKERKSVCLLLSPDLAREKLEFYKKKHQPARFRLLAALLEEPELPADLVSGKLNISNPTLKAMAEQKVLEIRSETVYRNPVSAAGQKKYLLALNEEQRKTADAIISDWDSRNFPVSLIHGVTGCGKTEIYMELIAHAVSRGEQAIVLIPEIALTYQTVLRFYRRFGERISIMNSRLSAGERYDQYEQAKRGLVDVMIGPRSALFTPFPNLGIIIIDEEHEESYKSESVPRYHARETAIRRADLERARVVLGSATPSLEAYYRAKKGEYALYSITKRVGDRPLPRIFTEDMRKELLKGNRSILSSRLHKMIGDRLAGKRQVMLFLNRRGFAGFLSCRSCGHVIQCSHCDVSLSLHRGDLLVCHYCGRKEPAPDKCPGCGSPFISPFRVGTQQVESFVRKEFPDARILRMDLDTTKEKDGHARILSAFAAGEADILIGTQMIVKGHDFPWVTLVGVLAADLSLHAGNYRAGERTFQLLTQAAGRAGRGEEEGEVVIQTYDPDNYSIKAAAAQDYEKFYEQEILFRQLAGYPPVSGMLAIHGAGGEEEHLQTAMDYIRKLLDTMAKRTKAQVIGPADEAIGKINDIYRKVIYLKHQNAHILTMMKDKVAEYIEMNEGYRSVHIQFDMNE